MLKPTDIKVGNLIQYDHDERRKPPVCMQRGWVKEIHSDGVVLTNGEKRKWERTEGLPIDIDLMRKLRFYPIDDRLWRLKAGTGEIRINVNFMDGNYVSLEGCAEYKKDVKFIHDLQNIYQDQTGELLEITVPEPRPIHPQQ